MNGPEILHLVRRDLQHAVARRSKLPAPNPMAASPWVAMSAIQKAIRRGREDVALSAAATLLRDAPERLWRRLGVIAYEDVGLASLDAVGLATAALGDKRVREDLGGEWPVASCIICALAHAPKCRAADDLLMSCELRPTYAQARADLPLLTTRDLITVATGGGEIHERALALWYALGTDRRSPGLALRRGEPKLVFDVLCEAGWPHSAVEIAREAFRCTREVLCPLVALLACEPRGSGEILGDDLPPGTMIGDAPSWALDLHTRDGRAAFARFLQTSAPSAIWVRRHVKPGRRVAFFGHCVFRVEGGLVDRRLRWPLGDALRREGDLECSAPECADATEILALTREDIPRLNEARAEIFGRTRHD